MEWLKVVRQELLESGIRQTLENGLTRTIPYFIDEKTGEKYCETDPHKIKVSVH